MGTIASGVGWPSPDGITNKVAEGATQGLKRLGQRFKELAKFGELTVTCPRGRFRLYCVVTSECQDSSWVVTSSEFRMKMVEIVDPPYVWQPSGTGIVAGQEDLNHALLQFHTKVKQLNATGEQQVKNCENNCQ